MNTNDKMQLTSSASSAGQREMFENYMTNDCLHDLQELSTNEHGEYDDAEIDNAWSAWKAAFKANTIVPQVVQAPIEPVRPDILEKLTYHKYQRDDLTLDDCLEYLCNQWKKIHGRTERAMVMQITELLASQPVAAPIVATVPSEPVAEWQWRSDTESSWIRTDEATARRKVARYEGAEMRALYAAPSHAAQASDVRNAALEEAIEKATYEPLAEPYDDFMHGYIRGRKDSVIRISKLKSATPADKGNAPVEAKS